MASLFVLHNRLVAVEDAVVDVTVVDRACCLNRKMRPDRARNPVFDLWGGNSDDRSGVPNASGAQASWRGSTGPEGDGSRSLVGSGCHSRWRFAAGSQPEEAMAVPACAGDRLGDRGQASIGIAVPGIAVLENGHPFQFAAPFPSKHCPRPEVDAIARGGRP